jgi:hypothetical protein
VAPGAVLVGAVPDEPPLGVVRVVFPIVLVSFTGDMARVDGFQQAAEKRPLKTARLKNYRSLWSRLGAEDVRFALSRDWKERSKPFSFPSLA